MFMNYDLINFFPIVFLSIFFAILFLQSGLDKILDYHNNLAFFKSHFSQTFFKKQVLLLLLIITFLEFITGLFFLVVLFNLFLGLSFEKIFLCGLVLSNITFCCLFLGQRLAKDYEGAVNLAIYFLISFLGFFFL